MMEDLPPADLIEEIEDLEYLADRLRGAPAIAVDLEADSFYTYYPKICLVQISTREEDFIVDPLSVQDMSPLGPIFRDTNVEKVFHAAEYDLQCLKRDYGFEVTRLFDTMAASRIMGAKELGLGALVLKHFNIQLSKKMQRSDWGRRPLTDEQIDYAQLDTHYLLPLRDALHQQLAERDLLKDAEETFARLMEVEPIEKVFDPDGFWRLPGVKNLPPPARAVLKELYFYREKTAATLDRAPFRVLPEPLLVRLAERLPADMAQLQETPGMTPYLYRKFGKDLIETIEQGKQREPIDSPPPRNHPKPDIATMQRFQALRQWRKKKAAEKSVDPVVILATSDLRQLAQAPSSGSDQSLWLSALSERKKELYGEEVLSILSSPVAASTPPRKRPRRR